MKFSELRSHKWVQKAIGLFKQGLTANEMAKSIAIGALVGVIPMFGISTVTITALAIRLRLNLPMSIFFTYAVGPIHLLMFIPFIKMGERILGVQHTLVSFSVIREAFSEDYMKAIIDLSLEIVCGLTGWALVAIPTAFVLYFMLRFVFSFCWKAVRSGRLRNS